MPEQSMQEQDTRSQPDVRRLALWVIGLLVILIIVGAFMGSRFFPSGVRENVASDDAIRMGEVPKPVFSADVQQKLERTSGFQVLVSYTDRGFEPHTATLQRGETVRFTNNSTRELRIIQKAGAVSYGEGACDTATFESCATIAPRDFWEFTFDKAGTWMYVNGLNVRDEGVIKVE